jgi:uncharacterized membrane protein YedE/YeeE
MRTAVAGIWGVVFGVGLALGGMTNPAKVLAFLDVAGAWDPTLAFVMGGALGVSALGFALARRRERPWLSAGFSLPSRKDVDVPLVTGAALFGVGWGLIGLCPGPALASLARGSAEVWIFVVAMAAGAFAQRAFARRPREAGADRAPSPPFADRSPRARPSE